MIFYLFQYNVYFSISQYFVFKLPRFYIYSIFLTRKLTMFSNLIKLKCVCKGEGYLKYSIILLFLLNAAALNLKGDRVEEMDPPSPLGATEIPSGDL